jgi:hypothetical protein
MTTRNMLSRIIRHMAGRTVMSREYPQITQIEKKCINHNT